MKAENRKFFFHLSLIIAFLLICVSLSAAPQEHLPLLRASVPILGTEESGSAEKIPPDLQERIDSLAQELEHRREQLHIPGMAIAVVKDDKIILARGFGLADIEHNKPVIPETLFAIGSTTKAFTSALIGMLVDEGKMSWDDPVTRHIPYFKLDIDSKNKDAAATIRDLLSHRTGFSRMSMLFAKDTVSREEVLQAAVNAEPWTGFRKKFFYNNIMYLAAGMAAGKAAESDWDTSIGSRIFKPLGMSSSNTSTATSQKDDRLSLGYQWDEEKQKHKHLPMRVLDHIAPAGAINSNVLDMAKWVRFQLGRGVFDGKRRISEAHLGETWARQMEISKDTSYGLGWMLQEWKGQPVLQHGGNIDGFAAQVALLPESNLGFALLTNVTATPLQGESINMVWEALLGKQKKADNRSSTVDFEPYLGKYIANFGQFKDTEFTVIVQNDRLAIDVPGQRVYELNPPGKEGKWTFLISDQIAVSFVRDDSGRVIAMKQYQAGYIFELPRAGIERPPEVPLDELQKYLGSYNFAVAKKILKIVIKNNCLALDIPGDKTNELRAPDEEGKWVFRVIDVVSVSFEEAEDGRILSLTINQEGQEFKCKRIEEEDATPFPNLPEILALRKTESRQAALKKLGTFRLTGTASLLQAGIKGSVTLYAASTDEYRQDLDFGKFGCLRSGINKKQGWREHPSGRVDELTGKYYESEKHEHPAALFADWRDFFESVIVLRTDVFEGRKVCILKLKGGAAPDYTITVDMEAGDVLKAESATLVPGTSIQKQQTTLYEDYREVHGLRIPFRIINSNDWSGRTIVDFEKLDINLKIDDGFFSVDRKE